MKKKKKGNIFIYSLGIIILFLALISLTLNMNGSWTIYNKVQTAAEEGSRVRAQAIDIYLKEAAGIVEAFHPPSSSGYVDNVKHEEYTSVKGHSSPLEPYQSAYVSAEKNATDDAKKAIVDMLEVTMGTNLEDKKTIENFTADNVCVDIKPLPETKYDDLTMDFSCETSLGTVSATDVKVSPVEANTYVLKSESGSKQKVKVVNVVFVGIAFEHRHYLEQLLRNFNLPTTEIQKVWSIAYPQVDTCYGSHCK